MKILMVCTEKLPVPPVRGGAIQTYIDGVSSMLGKNNNLTILGIEDADLPAKQYARYVSYVRVKGGTLDTYMEEVVRYIKDRQFDVIHIFNRPRLVMPIRRVAPKARLILSMHNDMFGPEKIDADEAGSAIKQLERIVTVSQYVGKTIAKLYPQATDKLRTIYSGVDLQRYIPESTGTYEKERSYLRNKYNLHNKKVILFVGRLSPKKGADILVRSMKELARDHKNATLVLVGSKWYSDEEVTDYVAYVRALADRSPVPVVTTGFVKPDQVHKWFWAGDLFVCPSQWQEPLARVHYEAMAAGLPIVTTARGGNPEVISEYKNGVLIKQPEEPKEFAKTISDLLSNPKFMQKMGDYGRKLAIQNFGWSDVAKEIQEVWDSSK